MVLVVLLKKCSNLFVSFSFIKTWAGDWRSYIAEFLGTFVFIFIACGAVLTNAFYADIGPLGLAFAAGVSYAVSMFMTVHLSGGNLNPAVTLALWLTQKIRGHIAVFYILAQILASFAAAQVLLLIFGQEALDFALGGPEINADITLRTAVIVEVILTAILIFAYFAAMVDKRGPVSFGPLVIGVTYAVASIFGQLLSGAALNPARAIGPLISSQAYSSLAVWIIGPLAGSLFALVYDFLFLKKPSKK